MQFSKQLTAISLLYVYLCIFNTHASETYKQEAVGCIFCDCLESLSIKSSDGRLNACHVSSEFKHLKSFQAYQEIVQASYQELTSQEPKTKLKARLAAFARFQRAISPQTLTACLRINPRPQDITDLTSLQRNILQRCGEDVLLTKLAHDRDTPEEMRDALRLFTLIARLANGFYLRSVDEHMLFADAAFYSDDRFAFPIRIIIQHADYDEDLQLSGIELLMDLYKAGKIEGYYVASLTDRVLSLNNNIQRYGLWTNCQSGQAILSHPLEDADNVDEWRAKLNLPPLQQHLDKVSAEQCSR